jgi:cell division protein FtsB
MSHDTETPQTTPDRPAKSESRPPSRAMPMLPVLNTVVLLASLGLLGYLFYEQSQESKAQKPAQETAEKSEKTGEKIKPEVDKLKGDVTELKRTVEERPAPPNYAPQIKALDDRIADAGKTLADLTDRLDALGKKVDGLSKGDGLDASPKFEAIEKRIGEVAATLETLKARVATVTSPAAPASDEIDKGMVLFKQGKWAEAKDVFARLEASNPDDARVWYFAAVANGLATHDWKGESERLVAEGMAREKAGKPDKAKIDAAFSGLTTATGKDWLSFYRARASTAPEHR